MSVKTTIKELLPRRLLNSLHIATATRLLARIEGQAFDDAPLRLAAEIDLAALLAESSRGGVSFAQALEAVDQFAIPDGSGGVNPGDRRALYQLIVNLSPENVLEVGTHIGASTLMIALALGQQAKLTTVDISDVNCESKQPWRKYGSTRSPRAMIESLDLADRVDFITQPSTVFMADCQRTFDFIFLDGSHSADVVYKEIPAALKLLNPRGVILLHDYFPDGEPLWRNGSVVAGPFLATRRLAEEAASLVALPLGKLPWPTKLGSNVTSLALLARRS